MTVKGLNCYYWSIVCRHFERFVYSL